MFLKKANVLLFFLLNISATSGLRFFQSRKRKKNCLVKEQWNFHYVTCVSKFENCCPTGCCASAINNATTAYVKVCIVCAVIIVLFTFIYIEPWLKKKCRILKNACSGSGKNEVATGDLKNSENCHEMQTLSKTKRSWSPFSKSDVAQEGSSDDVTLTSVCSVPATPSTTKDEL